MTLPKLNRLAGALALLGALVVFVSGCPGKRPPALATATPGEAGASGAEGEGQPPAARPIEEGPDLRPLEGEGASAADIPGATLPGEGGPLADVRFKYDSAELSDEARATLEKHALWLQGQREVTVTIEGHCDGRGTVEYNLALGEQRARAVREYLASLGVAATRLRVVSYGKERPLDPGDDEAAYAKNRRAHFVVGR
jgi:peptidoglycan-associated lipoprotein